MTKSSSVDSNKLSWTGLINKPAHSSDDIDIGDIDAVSRDFIVVRRGFVDVNYYYIPISKVEGWDGNVLWLNVTEVEVVTKYERDDVVPQPYRYYIKDYPYYSPTMYFPELIIIPSKFQRPVYDDSTQGQQTLQANQKYRCDLCDASLLSEGALSSHVNSQHC